MGTDGDLKVTDTDTFVYPNDDDTELWAVMTVDTGSVVFTIEALANNDHGVKHDLVVTMTDIGELDGKHFVRVKDLPIARFGTTLRVTTVITAGSSVFFKAVRVAKTIAQGDNAGNTAPAPGASPGVIPMENEIGGDPYGNLRAAVADGDTMVNDEHSVLWINNGSGSSMDVWANAVNPDRDGFFVDQKVSVAAGTLVAFPEVSINRFGVSVLFTYTAVTSITVVGVKRQQYPG